MNKIVIAVADLCEENERLKARNAKLEKRLNTQAEHPYAPLFPMLADLVVADLDYNMPTYLKTVEGHQVIMDLDEWIESVEDLFKGVSYRSNIATFQNYLLEGGIKLEVFFNFIHNALIKYYANKTKEWLEMENAKHESKAE